MPDPVKEEFVNVGVALYTVDESGPRFSDVLFTSNWSRARCLDPDVEVEAITGLEQQLREVLLSVGSSVARNLQEALGGALQLTDARPLMTDSPEAELKLLSEAYLERRRPSSRDISGRQTILHTLRREFERQGVWQFLRTGVPVAPYTQEGDPLKIDFAYSPSTPGQSLVRMFQAVSLERDINAAKVLAFSCPRIGAGLREKESSELQLTAVIEAELPPAREVEFGKRVMRESGVVIRTVADIPAIAERAREELKL
jgi:Protein of unknown function (DUF3037)